MRRAATSHHLLITFHFHLPFVSIHSSFVTSVGLFFLVLLEVIVGPLCLISGIRHANRPLIKGSVLTPFVSFSPYRNIDASSSAGIEAFGTLHYMPSPTPLLSPFSSFLGLVSFTTSSSLEVFSFSINYHSLSPITPLFRDGSFESYYFAFLLPHYISLSLPHSFTDGSSSSNHSSEVTVALIYAPTHSFVFLPLSFLYRPPFRFSTVLLLILGR